MTPATRSVTASAVASVGWSSPARSRSSGARCRPRAPSSPTSVAARVATPTGSSRPATRSSTATSSPTTSSRSAARHGAGVDTAVGDACALDLADESADAVLLLGPLYHLDEPADRVRALAEARRVVRRGGVVNAAAISRWAPRLHGMLVERVHVEHPAIVTMIEEVERSGHMPPVHDGAFTGYAHTPAELGEEVGRSGLDLEGVLAVEGIGAALADLDERLDDPTERACSWTSCAPSSRSPSCSGWDHTSWPSGAGADASWAQIVPPVARSAPRAPDREDPRCLPFPPAGPCRCCATSMAAPA